ncbi:MAG: ATP-binding protein, partial [Polyangiales bacterium]
RHVVELLVDAVVAARGENIVYVNAAAERMLGWPAGELVGRPLTTIVPERLRAVHLAGIGRYRATHVSKLLGKPIRVPALRRDGGEVDVELTITVLPQPGGDDLFVASLRDLRERVELERQLTIHRQVRALTAAAPALVAHEDLDHVGSTTVGTLVNGLGAALGRVWFADDSGAKLHLRASAGLSTRTTTSSRATLDVATHPSKVGIVARTLQPFVADALRGDPAFDQEWIEREGIVAAAAYPLHHRGELHGVFVAFFRAPLGEELRDLLENFASMVSAATTELRLLARLQAAVEARDQFLTMASHELNTPITTLKLQLDGLSHTPCDDRGDHIQRARRQVTRLVALVHDLLDASRIAEGRLTVSLRDFDLGELVSEVIDRHTVDLEKAGCQVELRLAERVHGLWDRDRIDQVVTNLVSNAIKYGKGAPLLVIVEWSDGKARLSVRDHGIGIAPEDQQRVFDRFERAVPNGAQPGLGIGLWIARTIVEAHGGSLRLESERGRGSTFIMELPSG